MKIVIEKSEDGYCGYPLGFTKGAIDGQDDTYEEAIKTFINYYGIEKFNKHFEYEK